MAVKRVVMNPSQRIEYLNTLLELDGLSHIREDENAAYCPISLTSTPNELKDYLHERQIILRERVLAPAGITGYDPGNAPFSPDKDLTTAPATIYNTDSGKIIGARFFVGHDILSSDGKGIEREKATRFNRMAVMLMDANIRVSRMQPHRTICLQYDNFERQAEQFAEVFKRLKQFTPGMGFNEQDLPILIGFSPEGDPIDLEEMVYTEFPGLQYVFNGKTPIIELIPKNPERFYEHSFRPLHSS